MDATTNARRAFTSEYGRFCTLAARAVHYGVVTISEVRAAMSGRGDDWKTRNIRESRARANLLLVRAKRAGVNDDMIRDEAMMARLAIEGEWDVTLP